MTDDGVLLAIAIVAGQACLWALVILFRSREEASHDR